ncbi:MAG: NAD-dependent epimerase/dehydratase family protein [Bryobacterales bacterium]|nr:NAD-dependent epimerase/dehydratase family protein [Bryobacterales bacterium]
MISYQNLPVLITGGAGFIGSNLAIRLVELGARVTIVDPVVAGCGGNPSNLAPVRNTITWIDRDISDAARFASAIREAKLIFNLAGEISHIHSMEFPERDLLINTVSQLRFLQVCAKENPGVRIVYAGTRQVYGKPDYLPMDEAHPIRPVDFNGVHKYAANMYHTMLSRSGHLDAVVLRLTNVYGPRMALQIPCQGFLSTFLRLTITGQGLQVFGDGKQLRDPLFVDDAVDAFLQAAKSKIRFREDRTYNIGGPQSLSLLEIAQTMARMGGNLPVTLREFPADRVSIDIGSYSTDSSAFRDSFGWRPRHSFEDGLATTLAYYRSNLHHYLDPNNPQPHCGLPEHLGIQHRLTYTAV